MIFQPICVWSVNELHYLRFFFYKFLIWNQCCQKSLEFSFSVFKKSLFGINCVILNLVCHLVKTVVVLWQKFKVCSLWCIDCKIKYYPFCRDSCVFKLKVFYCFANLDPKSMSTLDCPTFEWFIYEFLFVCNILSEWLCCFCAFDLLNFKLFWYLYSSLFAFPLHLNFLICFYSKLKAKSAATFIVFFLVDCFIFSEWW